ncbi:hypothetical protein ZWY2020_010159 [Hordeum vulgare]|nr:hypothetical protein ZWY2020_010159 [Hordeum vulgare]
MPAAVACSVKCRPHHRLMTPQLPATLELLPRGAPAFADELEATRCRTLLFLSLAPRPREPPALPKPAVRQTGRRAVAREASPTPMARRRARQYDRGTPSSARSS